MSRKNGIVSLRCVALGSLLLAGCGTSTTPTNNTDSQNKADAPVAPVTPVAPVAPVSPVTPPRRPGDGYGGNPITEPIRQKFRIENQIQQTLAKRAIDEYKILHDGKGPKTHEQFMKEIAGQTLHLPTPPQGFEWRYDPKEETVDIQPIAK